MRGGAGCHTFPNMIESTRTGYEHLDTVVIGGGQTGLTVGYLLAQAGREFVILDASDRVGDAWRSRWDSLRLFTPARYAGLPGMRFPAKSGHYVTKDEVAAFLEAYANEMSLPVRSGTRVDRLGRDRERFVIDTLDGARITCDNVIVAMANTQVPKIPAFAPDLDPRIVQLHSSSYRNPSQLQEGPVLVVGLGNSGADIGLEVTKTHETYVSGEPSAVIPFRIEPWFARNVGTRVVRFMAVNVLSAGNPIGRKALPKMRGHAAPLVRVKPADLVAAGADRVPRVVGVSGGEPELADGRTLDVTNVIWCTGFRPAFAWIDLPIIDEEGLPRHERGVVAGQPGLYFVGLDFQYALWSETLPGMPRDARYVVDHLTKRHRVEANATV